MSSCEVAWPCLVAAALGVASGFPTALTCGERELEVGGPKIMGIVPYESERTLMVMRANGEMLSDGDTIAPSEKLTVKVSDTAGQVQLRAEGHGAWGEAACTDGGDGGVSCINNEWETTLCTFAGDADAAVTIWAGHAEGSGAPGVAVTKKFTLKVGTDSAQAPADVEVATDGETQTTVAAADRDSTVAAADRETTDAEASSVRSQPEERTPIARAAPSDLPEQLALCADSKHDAVEALFELFAVFAEDAVVQANVIDVLAPLMGGAGDEKKRGGAHQRRRHLG